MLSHFSRIQLSATLDCSPPGSSVHGFSRQEHWRGLLCPSPGDLPNPGNEAPSLIPPALTGRFFTTSTTWEALEEQVQTQMQNCVVQNSFLILSLLWNLLPIKRYCWRAKFCGDDFDKEMNVWRYEYTTDRDH